MGFREDVVAIVRNMGANGQIIGEPGPTGPRWPHGSGSSDRSRR